MSRPLAVPKVKLNANHLNELRHQEEYRESLGLRIDQTVQQTTGNARCCLVDKQTGLLCGKPVHVASVGFCKGHDTALQKKYIHMNKTILEDSAASGTKESVSQSVSPVSLFVNFFIELLLALASKFYFTRYVRVSRVAHFCFYVTFYVCDVNAPICSLFRFAL
jgi:hypothetical protein